MMDVKDPRHGPFVEAVLDRPDDDQPKLIYADWLDGQGDELCHWRAFLIREMIDFENTHEERATRYRPDNRPQHPAWVSVVPPGWPAVVLAQPDSSNRLKPLLMSVDTRHAEGNRYPEERLIRLAPAVAGVRWMLRKGFVQGMRIPFTERAFAVVRRAASFHPITRVEIEGDFVKEFAAPGLGPGGLALTRHQARDVRIEFGRHETIDPHLWWSRLVYRLNRGAGDVSETTDHLQSRRVDRYEIYDHRLYELIGQLVRPVTGNRWWTDDPYRNAEFNHERMEELFREHAGNMERFIIDRFHVPTPLMEPPFTHNGPTE
jgi:uncharacterized protein (TIGR02996 family)